MTQNPSTAPLSPPEAPAAPLHVAIIMDGNGRWATAQGQPRSEGHAAGALAVKRIVGAARSSGVTALTLYAFSQDNWKRPPSEVQVLMALFAAYLRSEAEPLARAGIRLSVIGRRERLPEALVREIIRAEVRTADAPGMRLRVAIDYSARDAIRHAHTHLPSGVLPSQADYERALGWAMNDPAGVSDVDVLIRTGGERRLSDFLVWECAYAELFFLETPWPEFSAEELHAVLDAFARRERRFGGIPDSPERRHSY